MKIKRLALSLTLCGSSVLLAKCVVHDGFEVNRKSMKGRGFSYHVTVDGNMEVTGTLDDEFLAKGCAFRTIKEYDGEKNSYLAYPVFTKDEVTKEEDVEYRAVLTGKIIYSDEINEHIASATLLPALDFIEEIGYQKEEYTKEDVVYLEEQYKKYQKELKK